MKSGKRLIPAFLMLTGIALAARGMAESLSPEAEPLTWLQFDSESQSFGMVPERTACQVDFRVRNIGPLPLHILGSQGSCSREGCVRALPSTYDIPAGEVLVLRFDVGARSAGAMSNEVVLFTDCPGRSSVRLVVSGEVMSLGGELADSTSRL